jgi:deoxyribodipyrimidine photolyase
MNLSKRVSQLNNCQDNRQGRYVLYWMQMFKRIQDNDALNFAIQQTERELPLVVFGKIRYMTSSSTGRKFDSGRYIDWTKTLQTSGNSEPEQLGLLEC